MKIILPSSNLNHLLQIIYHTWYTGIAVIIFLPSLSSRTFPLLLLCELFHCCTCWFLLCLKLSYNISAIFFARSVQQQPISSSGQYKIWETVLSTTSWVSHLKNWWHFKCITLYRDQFWRPFTKTHAILNSVGANYTSIRAN